MVLVVIVVVVIHGRATRGHRRAEQRARAAIAKELEERERGRQLGRRNLVEQIARLRDGWIWTPPAVVADAAEPEKSAAEG